METRDRDALLEKLYDQMERELQVNFFSMWFLYTFHFSVLSALAVH